MTIKELSNNMPDWHKAVVSLALGIYISSVIISAWFKLSFFDALNFSFSIPESITFFLNISVVIVFGFASGYIANARYFRAFLTFILITFLAILVIGSTYVLFGDEWLSLKTAASPWGTAGFVILYSTMVSMVISISISIVLLPAIKIGSLAYQYRYRE